jgi:hypothetical protein
MARKNKMKNTCWKGFVAYGLKTKGGRKVPNCVPKKKKENYVKRFKTLFYSSNKKWS